MSILPALEKNKGTVSSALGKELATKALNGKLDILEEAIELSCLETKNIKKKAVRSGAAKIVEIVAEKKPELVSPHLERLLPAFIVKEPQTRWMIFRVFGFCAHLNETVSAMALPYAERCIAEKSEGLCLASSVDLYLGDYGALSKNTAKKSFSLLDKSMSNCILNEQDWILEAFIKLYVNLDTNARAKAKAFAQSWLESSRKTTVARAKKILGE
jgi:hypothetical protein